MKKVLEFLKKRWPGVASALLILIVLPLGWFFSTKWNTSIRTERESAAKADLDKLKVKVDYAIPSIDPNVPAIVQASEPNSVRTEYFKKHRAEVSKQAEEVVSSAIAFNKRSHVPLVDGLFPAAKGQEAQLRASDFAERLVGTPTRKSVYTTLLESINAGEPTNADTLAQVVGDVRDREVEAIAGPSKRALTPEENQKIGRQLLARRLADYQQRSKVVSVYASLDSFPQDRGGAGAPAILRTMPRTPPNLRDAFAMQWDYWFLEDILDAIKLVNTGPDGKPLGVDRSIVKRILKIAFEKTPVHGDDDSTPMPSLGEEGAEAATVVTGLIEPKYNWGVTGRWSDPTNPVYDLRKAKMTLIVAADDLPKIFDAIARTNFMTITDIDLAEVDVWADLERGFYYGPESVVEVTIEIESVWLRAWTSNLMPQDVKTTLGVIDPPKPESDAPVEAATPPG